MKKYDDINVTPVVQTPVNDIFDIEFSNEFGKRTDRPAVRIEVNKADPKCHLFANMTSFYEINNPGASVAPSSSFPDDIPKGQLRNIIPISKGLHRFITKKDITDINGNVLIPGRTYCVHNTSSKSHALTSHNWFAIEPATDYKDYKFHIKSNLSGSSSPSCTFEQMVNIQKGIELILDDYKKSFGL